MPEKRTHSLFPPSAAERWMSCKASAAMSKAYGVYKTSADAQEGINAHQMAEKCAYDLLMKRGTIPEIVALVEDRELSECMRIYLEEIEDSYFEEPEAWIVEGKVDLSPIYGIPEQFGRADCMLVSGDELHVFDYKHGAGVPVPVEHNKQLMIYAWASLQSEHAKHIDTVTLHIIQPRAPGRPSVQTWSLSRQDLRQFGNDVYLAVQEGLKLTEADPKKLPEEAFTPSESNCRWCPARGSCASRLLPVAQIMGIPRKLPAPKEATDDQLAVSLKFKELAEQWFKDLEEEAFVRIYNGQTVPGFKIVKGNQGIRRWKDKKEAEEVIRSMRVPMDFAYKKEIISPTRAEELHKKVKRDDGKPVIGERQWKTLEALTTRNEGKPQLVECSKDDREPMVFGQVTEEDLEEIACDGPSETPAITAAPV